MRHGDAQIGIKTRHGGDPGHSSVCSRILFHISTIGEWCVAEMDDDAPVALRQSYECFCRRSPTEC